MIEVFYNIACDGPGCEEKVLPEPLFDYGMDEVKSILMAAETVGWKVYRLAQDVYYGKAWCPRCRPDKCVRCSGRGYYPKWPLDEVYGEPAKQLCEVCNGSRFLRD